MHALQPSALHNLSQADRRQSARHTIAGIAEISAADLPSIRGTVENISLGGCLIISALNRPPVGREVVVRFDIGAATFSMEGVVHREVGERGIAIRFEPKTAHA
jgi:c-di-GMP-binding flagellar brake protein YcgR